MKILRWPGAKWSIADKIVRIIPKHKIYLEPFFGSGAVFFNKSICNTEILNDLDGEVVNLFKCIRDYPEELAKAVYFTPYSREEYEQSFNRRSKSHVERARKFLVRANMARGAGQYSSVGWRHVGPIDGVKKFQRVVREWNRLPERIIYAANRLKDAEIENTDALELIKKYNHEDCLIYADPPYLLSTRKHRYYNVEMTEENEHKKLLDVLLKHKGPVMISGYDSELYNSILCDWQKHKLQANAEQGKSRTEVIWTNFKKCEQISMFYL